MIIPLAAPSHHRWLLPLLLLAGCAGLPMVGPDHRVPDLDLPGAWITALPPIEKLPSTGSTLDLSRWWRQLHDPVLDELVETAVVGNADLRLAQARLRQARAARQQAISTLFPVLGASTSITRSKNSIDGDTLPSETRYDAGFDASWEIDLFGGTRRGIEAATADLEAMVAELQQVRISVVAEVAQNYVEARSFQRRLAIANDNLASQTETLQITEWRHEAGLVTRAAVEQARTNREQTRATLPDLHQGLAQAQYRLAVLLGRELRALGELLSNGGDLPVVPATLGLGIPSDTLRRRPDLLVAERTLAAETARVGQVLARRFPSLDLNASFGWQAYSFGTLGGAGTLARVAGAALSAVLFDGGQLRGAVEVQNAVQEQALINYENSVLTALEEVENALKAHAVGRDRVEARRTAAEAARSAAELTRNLYQSGLADFQSVLDTDRTRLSAEDSLATAEAGLLTSLIQLYKALGGGWEMEDAR